MAITVETLQRSGHGFAVNATSADASGAEELVAAPGVGKALKLSALIVNVGAALDVTIGAGANAGAVVTPILGPLSMAADTSLTFRFGEPIRLAANTALVVDTSGAGDVCVYAEGFVDDA